MGKAKRSSGRAGGWAMKAEDRFIETLAESANVTLSAAAAGVSPSSAYRRRGRDACFRARWGEALATGYAQLEMALGARRGAGGGNPGGRGPGDRGPSGRDWRSGRRCGRRCRSTRRDSIYPLRAEGARADQLARWPFEYPGDPRLLRLFGNRTVNRLLARPSALS